MHLFKYLDPLTYVNGQAINGHNTISWVERYRDPGDFEIVAQLSSGLREFLPIGTLISHSNTLCIMMVENHQITDGGDIDPQIIITGRSYNAFLEHRIVGQRYDWGLSLPPSLEDTEYVLPANNTWVQAVKLVNDHIKTGSTFISDDAVANVAAAHSVSVSGPSEERIIRPSDVLGNLLSILEVDDLGCRVIRPHTFSGHPNPGTDVTFLIHDGTDRRDRIVFSEATGDISAADYLWSDKRRKTSALVVGKFVSMIYHGPEAGINRRVMLVDGQDIDGRHETIPTSTTLATIRTWMENRGKQALKRQRRLQLVRTDISDTPTYDFRKDYNIGDIVSVDSRYGNNVPMRVVEYVEIEDENGFSSHPTLEELEI